MVKTLYEICLKELILNFEYVQDLEYVPFDPFIKDVLNYIIISDTAATNNNKQVNKTILKKIGESHGHYLRQKDHLHFGSFVFWCLVSTRQVPVDFCNFIETAPQFITRLDLSMTPLYDTDLIHIKLLTNLVVLDLTNTNISDTGMSHLASFTQPNETSRIALPYLEILSIAYCHQITDRSLRYIPKMKRSLMGVDLSTTNITPAVASTFLIKHGYQRINKQDVIMMNNNKKDEKDLTAILTSSSLRFPFRHRPFTSNDISSSLREKLRKKFCPQHSPTSLITYYVNDNDSNDYCSNKALKDEKLKWLNNETFNPGYEIRQNSYLNTIINNKLFFNIYNDASDDCKNWKAWWWGNKDQRQKELVFIFKTSIPLDKKRPLELDQDHKMKKPMKKKTSSLQVKQSIDASTFLQNFQL
ncbi:hypothetical protein BJ944DRAFT_272981 [Cunninghamella echinulata]|nr:hypothetical protein BJ944DRAFT_272981 [Cunninghamella echinulata]